MEAQKFRDFITEGEIKPYRFVLVWYDDPEDPDDPEKTADKIIEEGKKLGCKGFKVDIDGAYSSLDEENGQRYVYDKDGRGFLVDENTAIEFFINFLLFSIIFSFSNLLNKSITFLG